MFRERCSVLENKKIAPGHYVLGLGSRRIGKHALPGQFIQLLCADSYEPLLPRPFSFLTADSGSVRVLYHVVGKGTSLLSLLKKGDSLWVTGPFGNGFSGTDGIDTFILVGGGVGIPPLYHWAQTAVKKNKALKKHIHVFLGARNQSLLLCEKDFAKLGVTLHRATEDGSKGKKGLITEVLDAFLASPSPGSRRIYACGPTGMLKAVSSLAEKYGTPCQVSVEVPMACGFGACLGCAIKVKNRATGTRGAVSPHRFAVACCEGPVFQGTEILWD